MKLHLNKFLLLLSAATKSSLFADAQVADVCESLQPFTYDSGDTKAATTDVSIDKAPWIQLDLSDSQLAAGAQLTIVGDTASQVITSNDLASNGFSAVFDGSSVRVELSSRGGVRGNGNGNTSRVVVSNVKVGLCRDDGIANSICGDLDDRIPSTDVRMGRIGGCTGWLISEDVFIQAGHCGTPSSSTRIHFVFGTGNAAPEDQYAVDVTSYQGVNGGVGNDWGAGRLFPNSVTGKLPGVAQSEKCGSSGCGWFNLGPVPSTTSGNNIRITGYGTAAVESRSQKTHVGALTTIEPTYIRYVPDTTGGNSGSPVFHEEGGYAIGVHTHGGCSATGGSNQGTRIDKPEFAAHVEYLLGLGDCEQDSDCNDGVFCNGVEVCEAGRCVYGAPVTCDDGFACTDDICNEDAGVCENPAKTCSGPGLSGLCLELTGECACSNSLKKVQVDIVTDNYPGETTWTVTDKCGSAGAILSGGTYTDANSPFSKNVCAAAGQYEFKIDDTYGDGICCNYGQGGYIVKYDGAEVASGGAFTSSETKLFGSSCEGDPTPPPTTPPVTPPPTTAPPTNPPTPPVTPPPTTAPPTNPPTNPPTAPPTNPPTSPPTAPPTNPPTSPPTAPPTNLPTSPPTAPPTTLAPTKMPTALPTGQPVATPGPTSPPTTGEVSKTIVCGRGDIEDKPCPEGLKGTALVDETHEIRCCRDCTGINCSKPWKEKCPDYVADLYAISKVDGVCKVGTFSEALSFCRNIEGADARLCTPLEMENSCAKGTGCRFDGEQIWTCAYDGHACEVDAECCGSCVNGQCAGEFSLFS